MRTKRMIFCVLAAVLMLGMMSVSAFADTYENNIESITNANPGDTYNLSSGEYEAFTIPAEVTVNVSGTAMINGTITVNGTLNVNGGTISNANGLAILSTSGTVNISGGTIEGSILLLGQKSITGGHFTVQPSAAYIEGGYVLQVADTGGWDVVPEEASGTADLAYRMNSITNLYAYATELGVPTDSLEQYVSKILSEVTKTGVDSIVTEANGVLEEAAFDTRKSELLDEFDIEFKVEAFTDLEKMLIQTAEQDIEEILYDDSEDASDLATQIANLESKVAGIEQELRTDILTTYAVSELNMPEDSLPNEIMQAVEYQVLRIQSGAVTIAEAKTAISTAITSYIQNVEAQLANRKVEAITEISAEAQGKEPANEMHSIVSAYTTKINGASDETEIMSLVTQAKNEIAEALRYKVEITTDKGATWTTQYVDPDDIADPTIPDEDKRIYATAAAQNEECQTFSYWSTSNDENSAQNVVSVSPTYSFIPDGNVTLYAIYGEDTSILENTVTAETPTAVSEGDKKYIVFSFERLITQGNVIGWGALYGTKSATFGTLNEDALDTALRFSDDKDPDIEKLKEDVKASSSTLSEQDSKVGMYTLRVDVGSKTNGTVYARGYVLVQKSDGTKEVVYSGVVQASFETASSVSNNDQQSVES